VAVQAEEIVQSLITECSLDLQDATEVVHAIQEGRIPGLSFNLK
jgi:hypothetical protein